jgi:hypothetical protein
MEPVIEWLNENELRGYPLLEGVYGSSIPENFLLDLTLNLRGNAQIFEAKLLNISRQNNQLHVSFTGDENTFIVTPGLIAKFPHYVRNSNGSLAVFGEGVNRVFADIAHGSQLTLNMPVEPATVFQFDGPWLGVSSLSATESYKSVSVTNAAKLPLELQTDISQTSLTGSIEFRAGFNYGVNFDRDRINMQASFGLGDQMSCVTEFVAPELKDCPDIISFINGVPPDKSGIWRFTAGTNIALFDGTSVKSQLDDNEVSPSITNINANTLFVGLTFLESDLCSPVQLLPTNN